MLLFSLLKWLDGFPLEEGETKNVSIQVFPNGNYHFYTGDIPSHLLSDGYWGHGVLGVATNVDHLAYLMLSGLKSKRFQNYSDRGHPNYITN